MDQLKQFEKRIESELADVLRENGGILQAEKIAKDCRLRIIPFIDGFIDSRARKDNLPIFYLRRLQE